MKSPSGYLGTQDSEYQNIGSHLVCKSASDVDEYRWAMPKLAFLLAWSVLEEMHKKRVSLSCGVGPHVGDHPQIDTSPRS